MQLFMDDVSGSESSDLRLDDLMGEYSSCPSVAQQIWCIEYVAKLKKDICCILAIMSMCPQCPDDLGKRTSEVVALRTLEFLFRPSKADNNDACAASISDSRVEFDLSLSSVDVLQTIIKEIPLSDLRPGMVELSRFNIVPFIAHKNSCLPKSALERLKDAFLKENQTNATSSQKASEPVLTDKPPRHIGQQCKHADKQPRHMDEQPMHMDEDRMHINEQEGVTVIDGDSENDEGEQEEMVEPINNWNADVSPPSSSPKRQDDVCVKCGNFGDLLVCCNRDCSAMVHEECLNCPGWLAEKGDFHCPQCWYHRVTSEYLESKKSLQAAREKMVEFLRKLAAVNTRLRDLEHPITSG